MTGGVGYGTIYPGCTDPATYMQTHLTIHGLWPQYSSGGYPATCTTEVFNALVPYEIGWDTMVTYWPDGTTPVPIDRCAFNAY
jgi:hypothetical protein